MKTLVLGAGFVGSAIVAALLERGHDVVVFGHTSRGIDKRAEFFPGDFRDPVAMCSAMQRCEGVICAGAYYPVYSLHRNQQTVRALQELRVMLDAVGETSIKKFVFTSTLAVMNAEPAALRHSTYHAIKHALHDEVVKAIANGLPGCIAIAGACFGPGDHRPSSGRVIVEIASRRLRFTLDGKMNAVDVRDVARAEVVMLERAAIGSVYELGNWNCLCSEFEQVVATIAGVPPPRIHVPYQPAKLAAFLCEFIQYHLGVKVPYLPQSGLDLIHFGAHLNSDAAMRDLEFSPRPIEETISDTVRWFRENGYLGK